MSALASLAYVPMTGATGQIAPAHIHLGQRDDEGDPRPQG